MDIIISISNTQYSALEYIAESPENWSENAVIVRAEAAIQKIVSLYTTRALDEGVSIPSTKEEIVADAYSRGWIQTVVDKAAAVDLEQAEAPTP